MTDDWKEQDRVLQQIPNLVVGWCHLHSLVYRNGKKGRETVLASCPSAVFLIFPFCFVESL